MQEYDEQSTIAALTAAAAVQTKPPASICSSSGANSSYNVTLGLVQLEAYNAMAYKKKWRPNPDPE